MTEAAATEVRAGLSTTLLLAVASVAAAVIAVTGEEGAFTPLTVACALAGLVPWALVAGGVRLPPWAFALLAVPFGVVSVAVGNNAGGMFPLMLVLVWLALTSRSPLLPILTVLASGAAIIECTMDTGSADESGAVYFVGGLGISWLSGAMLRRQERLTAQVRTLHDVEIERRSATERAHLAREVHDVVAHSLTVVMLNVTGARRALAGDPERADEALARAEIVGRDSLDSIRQVMDLLREPGSGPALPQPSLATIPHLVDGYREAGLDVELTLSADIVLDATTELVVYRIVQESLANVLQHATGATATVVLVLGDDGLAVTIANGRPADVPAPRSGRSGLGTRGMGERVRALGGTVTSGPTADGGWLVTARLPVRAVGSTPAEHG